MFLATQEATPSTNDTIRCGSKRFLKTMKILKNHSHQIGVTLCAEKPRPNPWGLSAWSRPAGACPVVISPAVQELPTSLCSPEHWQQSKCFWIPDLSSVITCWRQNPAAGALNCDIKASPCLQPEAGFSLELTGQHRGGLQVQRKRSHPRPPTHTHTIS